MDLSELLKPITFRPTEDDAKRIKILYQDLGFDEPSPAFRYLLRQYELTKEQKEQERIAGVKQRNYQSLLAQSASSKPIKGVEYGFPSAASPRPGPNDGVDVGSGAVIDINS